MRLSQYYQVREECDVKGSLWYLKLKRRGKVGSSLCVETRELSIFVPVQLQL